MELVINYPGPPTHHHWAVGDTAIDSNGVTWICKTAGLGGGTAAFNSTAADDDTSDSSVVSTATPSSGVAFTPNAARSVITIPVTHAGVVSLTMGPTAGTENAILTTLTTVAGVVITQVVPAGWKVIVTLASSATIGTVAVQTI